MNWANVDWGAIGIATIETLQMTGFSLLFTVLIGLPLGIILFLTGPNQLLQHGSLYQGLSLVVNVLRSMPFIILLIVMIPLTRQLTGTSLGVAGTIPPLVASAAPFFARLVENVFKELDPGASEACEAMGANAGQTVFLALLPEAKTGLIAAMVVTAIMLVSYSAMTGAVGGGGLGDLAIRFGYQRYRTEVMLITVVILIVLVQLIQWVGDYWIMRINRRIS